MMTTSLAWASPFSSRYLFAAKADGSQEVPTVNTGAVGMVTFYLSEGRDTLCITGTFNGLSGPVTVSHIHSGVMGVSGPPVVDLTAAIQGNRLQMTLTGPLLTPTLIRQLLDSSLYVNVHTAAHPAGEIRGQILPETDQGFSLKLNGAQEVPPNLSTGTGLGFFQLSHDKKQLNFHVVVDSLTGPALSAHLHEGMSGQTGSVVADLSSNLNAAGNELTGSLDPSAFLNKLLKDSIYLNVHTAAFSAGEVRGQLKLEPYLFLNGPMAGVEEVPPVATPATGEAAVRINYTFDTLWYDVQVNNLSGPITNAHFHEAMPGVSGPVLVAIPSVNIAGNRISGFVTGGSLSAGFIQKLMKGGIYVNVHTASHPTGEIRGQLRRLFREGYPFRVLGQYESPAVVSAAYGSGMVSIDRDQTNAHYTAVVTGLTPTMLHFHNNAPGVPGPVIYDLTSTYSNGGLFGYWKNDDAVPFTFAIAEKFSRDSVYINFHTSANPGGEIRGDIGSRFCLPADVPSGVGDINKQLSDIRLFPNPAEEHVTLRLNAAVPVDLDIEIVNPIGSCVLKVYKRMHSGSNTIELPLSGLAGGVYFVQLATKEERSTHKLIKE